MAPDERPELGDGTCSSTAPMLVASGSGPPVGLDVTVSRVVPVVGKSGTSDGLGACEDVPLAIVKVTPVVLRVVVEVVRRVE